ncbi:MAG: hypothetical protein ACXV3F_00740 [Frankiaceae bacterium]
MVLTAVLDALADIGYERLTIAAIQRRDSRSAAALDGADLKELVVLAPQQVRLLRVPEPTGSLGGDVEALLLPWCGAAAGRAGGSCGPERRRAEPAAQAGGARRVRPAARPGDRRTPRPRRPGGAMQFGDRPRVVEDGFSQALILERAERNNRG